MRKTDYSGKRNSRRAFTLYELVITIGLFGLVAGLVISYISFMTDYSADTEALSERTARLTEIRREVDHWFSYYDTSGVSVTAAPEAEDTGETVLAAASAGAVSYEIRLSLLPDTSGKDTFVQALLFFYPADSGRGMVNADGRRVVRIDCADIKAMRILSAADWEFDDAADDGDALRFTVPMRVTGQLFACEIAYA